MSASGTPHFPPFSAPNLPRAGMGAGRKEEGRQSSYSTASHLAVVGERPPTLSHSLVCVFLTAPAEVLGPAVGEAGFLGTG